MNVQEKRKMKPWLWPLLLLVSMLFAVGCDSDEEGGYDPSDYMEVELPQLSEEARILCYAEGNYVDKVYKNQKGIVTKCGDDSYVWISPLPLELSHMPLVSVNMPEECRIEGVEIVFSGERINCDTWDVLALPIILTDLKVKKSGIIK